MSITLNTVPQPTIKTLGGLPLVELGRQASACEPQWP